jgi:molybdate transport system ATP-binding protein
MAAGELTVDIERRYRGGPVIAATFTLELDSAETLVLFGPSGSGKTTILRCLAGLERPDRGRIVVRGERWADVEMGVHAAPQSRRIGYLPQGFALFPHLTVRENLAYGMSEGGRERIARLDELIALLGLDGLGGRRPSQLSGGQQQRVALGRALARRPVLLLLDEPLAALDAPTRESLRLELRDLLTRLGMPAIVVTHDRTEALVLGDRVAVMIDGSVRQVGTVEEVFDRPADAEVAAITGVETVVHGTVETAAEGMAVVRVGGATVTAVADAREGDTVLVSIRPEDVLVVAADHDLAGVSARTHLRGRISSIEPLGALVRVRIDCGFPLVALVTRQASEELGLRDDLPVSAIVKAPSVHLIRIEDR